MAITTYTYSVANDTLNGGLSDTLQIEIGDSDILIALKAINMSEDVLDIKFKEELTSGDETILDGIVAAHEAIQLEPSAQSVEITNQVESSPFASKVLSNGKKLFGRVHGENYTLESGENTKEFVIPYPQVKFNEIEIIGAEIGDNSNLKILDTATGTYSGVNNYELNQFGFDVYISKDFYRRKSNYDADLYTGMRICIEYNSVSAKDICINFVLHEVKD